MSNNNENITEQEKITTEHLALEILKQEQTKSKAKNTGIIGLTVAVVIITIGMALINYQNDQEWRKLFSEYDFISQDGRGINNISSGIQGDLNNFGSESEGQE